MGSHKHICLHFQSLISNINSNGTCQIKGIHMATELFSESSAVFMLMSSELYLQLKENLNISKFASHKHMFF